MDFRQLKYFVQIAEHGNFSRAAEALRTAQPSLSQQIKGLEEELGVQLFMRHARGVTMTDPGQQLYDHACRILQEMDDARASIRLRSSSPSGRVTVGLPTSACRGISVELHQATERLYPNVSLHIVEAMTGYLDELMQAGRIDIALLYNRKAFEHVACTEIMTEELMLFVPPDHSLSDKKSIPFREVFNWPTVLPGRPSVGRVFVEQVAARHDITVNAKDCDSLPTIAKMVRHSGLVTIMPHFALLDEIARGEVVPIPIVSPTPAWTLSVVISQRTMNKRGSEAIAATMADLITDMVCRGKWRGVLRKRQ